MQKYVHFLFCYFCTIFNFLSLSLSLPHISLATSLCSLSPIWCKSPLVFRFIDYFSACRLTFYKIDVISQIWIDVFIAGQVQSTRTKETSRLTDEFSQSFPSQEKIGKSQQIFNHNFSVLCLILLVQSFSVFLRGEFVAQANERALLSLISSKNNLENKQQWLRRLFIWL